MTSLLLLLVSALLSASPAQASTPPILEVGDLVLQPLRCWVCSLIQAEEDTAYSHMGVVLSTQPEVMIAEAWGKTQLVPLREYSTKTAPGGKLKILRFKNPEVTQFLSDHQSEWKRVFDADFKDHAYNKQFLWNNFDDQGREKFYCSELVSKLIASQIDLELPVKRMHFQKHRDDWVKYFHGKIPDGELGNSPADFDKSELFIEVGEL